MDRAEFLAARRRGIGGSDVAPILGLSKWRTPLDVYISKVSDALDDEETESMRWGNLLEGVIRDEYARRTGYVVERPPMLTHPEHSFIIANLDGMTECGRVVEIKTARDGAGWGEEGSDEVPDAYALQVQHYMLVTGAEVADVAVLIGGSEFRVYTIEADTELHEALIEVESEFWGRVQRRDPPEPRTYAEAAQRFARATGGEVEAGEDLASDVAHIAVLRAQIKALEAEESKIKASIACALGDRDTLIHAGRTLATWKEVKGAKRFDVKAFKDAHPELYSQFVKIGEPSRRLLIK